MIKIRNLIVIITFIVLAGYIGYQFGKGQISISLASNKPQLTIINQDSPKNIDFSLFWEVWNRLEKFYVDKSKIDEQKMVYGAISGMVASIGDPYTVFLNPTQNKTAKEDLSGEFEGVGIQLGMKDNYIVVIAPLKGTPADKAGIKNGDYIVKVDGKDATSWTLPEAVSKIRGPKGTKVTLTILHANSTKTEDKVLTRDTILVKSVELQMTSTNNETTTTTANNNSNSTTVKPTPADERIAYLKLSKFGDETNQQWDEAVATISYNYEQGKTKGMILDLRDNPGGYLSGAVYIASEFLESGVVVKQESATTGTQTYSVSHKGKLITIPLVVLVNKGSASASEIVSGALRDYKRAKLVGETTFGKGSVQEAQDLPNGAGIHITTAKWILPKGDWIMGKGITPDVKVLNDDKTPNKDLQLEKAKEILNSEIK